jgi:hypothetical protein
MASKGQKNGTENKKTGSKTASAQKPVATKKPASETSTAELAPTATGSVKPDQAAYNREQDALKAQIDAIQAKLVCFSFFLRFQPTWPGYQVSGIKTMSNA